jgi:hypothetical protein
MVNPHLQKSVGKVFEEMYEAMQTNTERGSSPWVEKVLSKITPGLGKTRVPIYVINGRNIEIRL